MRDPIILLVHLIATLARLMGPGGLRSVVAESVLVKHQLLILNRSRHRSPNLRASDRILAGVCALFMRVSRWDGPEKPTLSKRHQKLAVQPRIMGFRTVSTKS